MKLRKNIKAFTLVELIVTIAVLGVLVLLAAPRLLSYTEQAELTRIQHDTRIMENKMAEVLNQDNNYNEWDDNAKDLGTLILRNQLFEKEGLATRVDKSHLTRGVNLAQSDSDSELGVGGALIDLGDGETTGYKIIPEKFKTAIGTKLDGTFYSNENGKVYYEPNKPLRSIRQEQALACVAAEDLDYEFSVINGKGTITSYNGTLTHLYIPSAFLIDGKCVPVQVIGAGAFSNLGTLVRVYIPQSVERIEERAFEGNKLTQVEIPHSVNYIGENAFHNNNLSSETIVIKNESSNMTIIHGAFSGQPSGEASPTYSPVTDKDLGIVFDRSTGKIVASTGSSVSRSGSTSGSKVDNTSVSRNSYESYVRIPSTIVVENIVHEVKEIAQGAYQGQGIIFVEFPDTLERIEDYAFAGNQLINVAIPSNVGYVGNYAFAYNEINGERTMDFVEIKGQGRFEDNIDNLGNITSNGTKRDKVGNANLLDHIFITSSSNFEIPEEYNPITNGEGLDEPIDFTYKGRTETFEAPVQGRYLLEVWGAQGEGLTGGQGGYSKGEITLTKGQSLTIKVGGRNGYNGGGSGGHNGGGGTDIRLNGSSLNDRIIVAGGGGGSSNRTSSPAAGGYGGGASGGDGNGNFGGPGGGGTQTAGGLPSSSSSTGYNPGIRGYLGQGGNGAYAGTAMNAGGGGGGYYGGAGGSTDYPKYKDNDDYGGGGGSGYIGGIQNGSMIAGNKSMPNPNGGNMIGNSGNGYARITYIKR